MIIRVEVGASMTMPYDIVGHDDEATERVQRSLEAITKDLRAVVLSDGSLLPVTWTDEEGDEVENIADASYLIGGNDFLGYFSIAVSPSLLNVTEH